MKFFHQLLSLFIVLMSLSSFVQASFVNAKETRSLIAKNQREIENNYPQLVDDVHNATIKFDLGYEKDEIFNIIFHPQSTVSAMLEEENDDWKVFEDMLRCKGPAFLFFAIKFSCDGYDVSGESKHLAQLLTKRYLGCCGCCI